MFSDVFCKTCKYKKDDGGKADIFVLEEISFESEEVTQQEFQVSSEISPSAGLVKPYQLLTLLKLGETETTEQ